MLPPHLIGEVCPAAEALEGVDQQVLQAGHCRGLAAHTNRGAALVLVGLLALELWAWRRGQDSRVDYDESSSLCAVACRGGSRGGRAVGGWLRAQALTQNIWLSSASAGWAAKLRRWLAAVPRRAKGLSCCSSRPGALLLPWLWPLRWDTPRLIGCCPCAAAAAGRPLRSSRAGAALLTRGVPTFTIADRNDMVRWLLIGRANEGGRAAAGGAESTQDAKQADSAPSPEQYLSKQQQQVFAD